MARSSSTGSPTSAASADSSAGSTGGSAHRTRVPQAHVENGYRLGQKVANLRLLHRRGELSRERTEQLEQLLGWTWMVRSSPRTRTR